MTFIKRNIYIFIFVLYEELIFMLFSNTLIDGLILKILFSLQISFLFNLLFLFKDNINKKIMNILFIFLPIIYISQFLYKKIFNGFLSIDFIFKSSQVTSFFNQFLNLLLSNCLIIFLFFLPFFIFCFTKKKISYDKNNFSIFLTIIFLFQFFYLVSIIYIDCDKKVDIYSIKNLYYNVNNSNEMIDKFGILTTIRIDIQRKLFNFKEKKLYEYKDEYGNVEIIDRDKYNIIDIDFESLIENESDDEVKDVYKYLSVQKPTNKNDYTGVFEGKNVIVIMGESFSSLAIDETLTPTLYKLSNSGFKFNNFYTPLFPVSTSDGQYLSDTSLIPGEGIYSMSELGSKTFPHTYGNIFKNLGYNTYAYHNYDFDYYDRDSYFSALGFDNYLACGNGLENRMNCSLSFNSDYEMVKETINDYVKDDKFFTYYVTMSGHLNYDKSHDMVKKNWDKVKDLDYSYKVKSYLATQIEFDKAVEEIINVLKENNKIDDTVIVISGDHYPYGLTEEEMKEIKPMNDYYFDRFKMPLIIYNSDIENVVEVDKTSSSLDILPTLLNLFGVKYDSRVLMGKDIFSNSESLVIFSDRGFISSEGKYNSRLEVFYPNIASSKDYSEYIYDIKNQIYFKYRYSRLILINDLYKQLF